MKIQYFCDNCLKLATVADTMACGCGGTFRPDGWCIGGMATTYEKHFDPVIRKELYSWRHQEREAANFRSEDHPEGMVLLQDNKKYMNELKYRYKHREDALQAQWAKDGIKYPKGKDARFDDRQQRFVNKFTGQPIDSTKFHSTPSRYLRVSDRIKKTVAMLACLALLSGIAYARIEGVEYVTLTIHGKDYDVPIHDDDFTESKAKIVMDMLDGDKNSRKIFLGGQKEKLLFIGDSSVRWLHVTATDEWVTE